MRWGVIGLVLVLGCGDDGAGEGADDGLDSGSSSSAPSTSDAVTTTATSASGSSPSSSGSSMTASSTDSSSTTSTTGPIEPGEAGSLVFAVNGDLGDDYADLTDLPAAFGTGEFTFEIWALPDDTLDIGPTAGGSLENWSDADPAPYSEPNWWFSGNFLLDGHNNGGGWENGSFDLQLYGSGRVRWLFGDGELRGVQAAVTADAESLLDGLWHHIATVRRASANGATLELWVDGTLVATDQRDEMVDMRQYWDDWAGFGQPGWFLGAEKGSAWGANYWDDYKGLVAEARMWTLARPEAALQDPSASGLSGEEEGLVGWFRFGEGAGDMACDNLDDQRCFNLFPTEGPIWSDEVPD